MKTLEQNIESQINTNKNGVYGVFVEQGQLREYLMLPGDKSSKMMQKVFVPVFDGEMLSISFEIERAITNLLSEAGVETLEELEAIR